LTTVDQGTGLEEPGGKQMNTEERNHHRTNVKELNDQELEAVTGGDKKSGGTTTAAPKEYLQFKMTEVFISSIN
jgi:bacteriocin-like protein